MVNCFKKCVFAIQKNCNSAHNDLHWVSLPTSCGKKMIQHDI